MLQPDTAQLMFYSDTRDLENPPESDELASKIIENLEAGLNSFREVLPSLKKVS